MAAFFVFFAVSYGPVVLFPNIGFHVGVPRKVLLGIGLLFFVGSFFESKKSYLESFGNSAFILVLFYSLTDLTIRNFGFFQIQFPILTWILFSSLVFILFRNNLTKCLGIVAGLTILSSIVAFYLESNGMLLFTDDHPCFLYRLIQLKDNFPNIPFYNPLWNAGVEAREFFASGILNVFLLFSPIIYLFKVESIYNILVLAVLFGLMPLSCYFTGGLLNLTKREKLIYIILSLSSSIMWYRWSFAYGTLGFVLSSILVPLNLALFGKHIESKHTIKLTFSVLSAISVTLMFLWSPSVLIFSLIALLSIFKLKSTFSKKGAWVTLILIIIFNAPWATVFYQASGVSRFLSGANNASIEASKVGGIEESGVVHDASKFKGPSIENAKESYISRLNSALQKQITFFNPLIVFFGFGGLFLLKKEESKLIFCGLLSLAFLGFIGPLFKPQLELERMIVIFFMVLAIPAARLISEYLDKCARSLIAPSLVGLLALTPLWSWRVMSGETSEKPLFATGLVENLAKAIHDNTAEGRALFTGFILHELDGGHVAPLAAWTGRPLIASSFQHDSWKYKDVIPVEFRSRKTKGVIEFFDLMNVSTVIAHDRFWRKWLLAHPSLFERVWGENRFHLFRRKNFKSNYFLEGEGEVLKQNGAELVVKLKTSSALLKFNYLPFLRARGCIISPEKVSESLTFIRLSECSMDVPISLESQSLVERFF